MELVACTMSTRDEGLIPILQDRADHDDIAVTLEPSMNREQHLDDSLSSTSDTPSVDHFNISVRLSILTVSETSKKRTHWDQHILSSIVLK